MRPGDRVTVTVFGDRVPATVVEPTTRLGNVLVRLDDPIDDPGFVNVAEVYRARSDVRPLVVDEAVGGDDGTARRRRWAIWYKQFELRRAADHSLYLTRWWLVDTPWGGIALHRMDGPDARTTLHDHPFDFTSFVLRGGYIERRLRPTAKFARVDERHRVRWVASQRAGIDAHAIIELLRVPTWTLVFAGRKRRRWGFWEPCERVGEVRADGDALYFEMEPTGEWTWTDAEAYDSGHYVPLPDGTR